MKTHHFEHDDTIRCYHCGNIVPMKLVGRDVSTWDEGDDYLGVEEWSFYLCPTCKEPTLLCYVWQQHGNKMTFSPIRSIAYPHNLFDDQNIPETIRLALHTASETNSLDKSIVLIAWRRVIELICDNLDAVGKNLFEKITYLSEQNIIPRTINDASHLVRVLGNEGAHTTGAELAHVSINEIATLVKIIVEYVYVLPAKISNISEHHQNSTI